MDEINIGGRVIGSEQPVYIVAEISANHGQSFENAVELVRAGKACGADAVKLQTYTPDTITLDSERAEFTHRDGPWKGQTLYDLYHQAYTPWEWQPELKKVADQLGLELFSSPFDDSAVDFLEGIGVRAYKVASFELVDLPLIQKIASTGKPMILSTGMATLEEIDEAVNAARVAGAREVALLKCTSAYPAKAEEMNLKTIPELAQRYRVPVGLSDHTLGIAVPVAAAALGACIIEKHITLSRTTPGPDSAFSLEPEEFKEMVAAVRTAESALGSARLGITQGESASRAFRRSLFVVQDIKSGDIFTRENVRSIRPGSGMHPRYLSEVLGKRAACDLSRGTPLRQEMVREWKAAAS